MFVLSLSLLLPALTAVWAAPVAGPDAPDFMLGPGTLARRQDYDQDYTTDSNVDYQSASSGYSVTFSGASDFVVGKGWTTGSARNITFEGSTTQTAGTVLLAVYGWTRNPLVEYYIEEYASDGKGSAQGDVLGTVESDGSTYDIYQHTQTNQPSIDGTSTFTQFISVRRDARTTSGTVTVQNHFDAWESVGLTLGTSFDYQVLATEGWGSASGNSEYTISTGSGSGSSSGSSSSSATATAKASSTKSTTKTSSSAFQQTTFSQTTKTTKVSSTTKTSANTAQTSNVGFFTKSAAVSTTTGAAGGSDSCRLETVIVYA